MHRTLFKFYHAYPNTGARQIEKNPSEQKTEKKDSVPTFENDISEHDNSEQDSSEQEDSEDDDDGSENEDTQNEDSHMETDSETQQLKSKFFVILTTGRHCSYVSACILVQKKFMLFCGRGFEVSLPPP